MQIFYGSVWTTDFGFVALEIEFQLWKMRFLFT